MLTSVLLSAALALGYIEEAKVAVSPCPKWVLEDESRTVAEFRNRTDGGRLQIRAFRSTARNLESAWNMNDHRSAYYLGPSVPYSGLPLGSHIKAFEHGSELELNVRNLNTFITVQVAQPERNRGGPIPWIAADKAGDRIDVEGVARRLIALVEGRWSTSDGTARVAGRDLARRRCRGGAVLVPLTDWATARGVSLRRNDRLGSAAFDLGGRAFVIPLGARSLKVGSSWVPFNGTVTHFEGKWYVPLDVLEGS